MQLDHIETRDQYDLAIAEIERLWGSKVGTPQGDELDRLMAMVEAFEAEHEEELSVDPIDVIKAHMEATGRSQSDLAELLGSKSRASELLNRRRALTTAQVHLINKAWRIPAGLLVTPYDLDSAKKHGPGGASSRSGVASHTRAVAPV